MSIKDLSTSATQLASGNTAQRPASPTLGQSRYNSTTDSVEFYTSSGWVGISGLSVSSVTPSSFSGESGTLFTITGTGFVSGSTVTILNAAGTSFIPGITSVVNVTTMTFTTPQDFTVSDEPLSIRITTPGGQTTTLNNAIDCGSTPTWVTSAGSLGTFYDIQRSSFSATISATDPDSGATITYSVYSGSLPSGVTLSSSTGVLSGTPAAVGSDTTYSFTARATDNAGNSTDRTFSITIKAPVVTSFTSTGAGTFSVPSGLTAVRVLVVAGGGGGASNNAGGGGAGGMIDYPSFPVTPGGTVPLSVGAGGTGDTTPGGSSATAPSGTPSIFGSLTAVGGGGSDGWTSFKTAPSGGSGAGGAGNPSYRASGGTGTQSSQPGASGTYGYGYPGGLGGNATGDAGGGGGGGAAGAGVDNMAYPGSAVYPGSGSAGGHGGLAKISNITGANVYYAGGGGGGAGGAGAGPYWPGTVIGGIGGIGGPYTNPYASTPLGGGGNGGAADRGAAGSAGTANTGGGGGGGDNTNGGNGGSGIIVVKY